MNQPETAGSPPPLTRPSAGSAPRPFQAPMGHPAGVAQVAPPARTPAQIEELLFEVKRLIVGQDRMLERLLVALVGGGHVLLEGVPGLAKTAAIKALAAAIGG